MSLGVLIAVARHGHEENSRTEPKAVGQIQNRLRIDLRQQRLTMPLVGFVLLASIPPLQFPLLNLSTRDRHDARCQPLEKLEWGFTSWLRLRAFHVRNISLHGFDRKTYTTDVPTAMMIKSVRINRAQSMRDETPDSVNRNA